MQADEMHLLNTLETEKKNILLYFFVYKTILLSEILRSKIVDCLIHASDQLRGFLNVG